MNKEIIDQSAHFGVGLVATLILSHFINIYLSAGIVLIIAVGREIYQRISKGNAWYACHSGCRLDILFWALGIITGALLNKVLTWM